MCLWLSLQGTGPITCTGEPGIGLHPGGCSVGGNPRVTYLQEELLRWAQRQQRGPFIYVGKHEEFGPIYKHRGALSLGTEA